MRLIKINLLHLSIRSSLIQTKKKVLTTIISTIDLKRNILFSKLFRLFVREINKIYNRIELGTFDDCSDFRNESKEIFVLGQVGFFSSDNF